MTVPLGGITAPALRQLLQRYLKPWCFTDIDPSDIVGVVTNDKGDIVASVNVDGTTIGGDGLTTPLFLIKPQLGILNSGVAAVPAGVWNFAVVLNPALAYAVITAMPNWNTTVYFSANTSGGFTLNFSTQCPPGGGSVMWALS